jgi:hypothetical protein
MPSWLIPGLTAVLALAFVVALLDQWHDRRHTYQIVWAIGMAFFGIAAGAEAVAGAGGWNEALYRTWYLSGAVWTAGWLGLGTAFLLQKTRFGYAFAFTLFLGGLFTFLTQRRFEYPGAGVAPILYFVGATILGLAVAVETYFQNERWPRIAALGVIGATLLSIVLMAGSQLPAPGYAIDPATDQPVATLFPGSLRLLTPFLNVTGGLSLLFGALFSAYVFMPKRRILAYSLDAHQRGVPVQPPHLPGGDHRELRGLAAGRDPRAPRRPAPQPRSGHPAHRRGSLRRLGRGRPEPVRDHRAVRDCQARGRRLPPGRVPRLDRGVPRASDPVHPDPAGCRPQGARRRRDVAARTMARWMDDGARSSAA